MRAPLIRVVVFLATLAVMLLVVGLFGWLGTFEFLLIVAAALAVTIATTRNVRR